MLTRLQDVEDTDSGEYSDEESSLKLYDVDTEDMDVDEYSLFTYLRKILRRLNNIVGKDDEEQEKHFGISETLCCCMGSVKDIPKPEELRSLEFVRDIRRSYDRADELLAENPRKKLAKFSLLKIAEAKDLLESVKNELTAKFSVCFEERMKIVQACRKMGEPEDTSSLDKFEEYANLLEKDMKAFWRKRECARIISETERVLNLVERVEKVVRGQFRE
ncbi:hypothetical protein METSCH_D04300 [Metschnikowia aff. pulcherrima]|uniref:Uncharacterized protein n=1 Tax=Metschnikowia aff. pulcherrima TaxID=2163413 RepID=A0A4P6XPQ2_9ASCO|nr:hypothetical protein METSCH_D04300 [Metschnikowia aff. pulcherrima]